MPNTINIVQPKAEDGVTDVSFVTRTNSIFKSDGTPLGDSMDAYMDEVDELSQNLTELHDITLANGALDFGSHTKEFGGVAKYGNIVIVNIRMTVKASVAQNGTLISGFPPYTGNTNGIGIMVNNITDHAHVGGYITPAGNLNSELALSANKTLLISGIYICG